MLRTVTCGELNKNFIGKEEALAGWVDTRRDHGNLIFVDLRDRWGVTQVVFNPQMNAEMLASLKAAFSALPPRLKDTPAPTATTTRTSTPTPRPVSSATRSARTAWRPRPTASPRCAAARRAGRGDCGAGREIRDQAVELRGAGEDFAGLGLHNEGFGGLRAAVNADEKIVLLRQRVE